MIITNVITVPLTPVRQCCKVNLRMPMNLSLIYLYYLFNLIQSLVMAKAGETKLRSSKFRKRNGISGSTTFKRKAQKASD